MKETVFMFTTWTRKREELNGWLEWFHTRGIPAGIVRGRHYGGRPPMYAVFRYGHDYGEDTVPLKRAMNVFLEDSVNGFSKFFNDHFEKGGGHDRDKTQGSGEVGERPSEGLEGRPDRRRGDVRSGTQGVSSRSARSSDGVGSHNRDIHPVGR